MNIAVSGGMGSGKSRVTEALADMLDLVPISADTICRNLLVVGGSGHRKLQELLGEAFFLDNEELDRPALRKVIFSNSTIRGQVDGVLHPLVREDILKSHACAESNRENSVAEVPLLFEKGWQDDFDYSVVVFASEALCVSRIVKRDRVTEEEARLAIQAQMGLDEKCRRGDRVIDNSGTFEKTVLELHNFVSKISSNPLFFRKGDYSMKKS